MEVSNMVTKIRILFRVFVFIGVFSGYNANQTVKVVVPSQDWYIAAVGSDFTARCDSNSQIIWRKRGNEDVHLEGQITKEDNKYVNKLVLLDLTYRFVGFYDCLLLNRTSDVYASFYLYVDDPVHLTLGPSSLKVHSTSYQQAVVPCRPTAPDVFVKLRIARKDLMANSTTRSPGSEERIYFDSQRGFIMPAHLMEPAWFINICEFSKRGVVQEMNVDLFISYLDLSDNIVHEFSGDTGGNILAKPGDTVVLPVEVFTEGRPNNMWVVRRADGQVFELAQSGVINERSNKIRVEETDRYPWETKLVIRDVNKNDEGAYILSSYTTSYQNEVTTMFYVYVGEATGELSMEIAKVVKVHDYRSIQALCLRKPDERQFKVKWSFRPLDCTDQAEPSCEERVPTINPLKIDERPSEGVLSAAVLELPRLGNLTCTVHFDDGFVESVTKPVILSEVEDGFEVKKLFEEVDEPAAVTLQCVVSKYLYSDHLYWIAPEGHVVEDSIVSDFSTDFTKLRKSENEFSYILELGFKNLTRSRGNYSCMAVNNDHKPEFKTYIMNISVPVPQQFFANLDNNTLLVPSTSTVTLSCNSEGIQTSATLWVKNGEKLPESPQRTIHDNGSVLIIHQVHAKDPGLYSCKPEETDTYNDHYIVTLD